MSIVYFVFEIIGGRISFSFSMFVSLGIVLTRGYGQYIFIGNVSVEEGKSFFYLSFSMFMFVCLIFYSSSGLHDLLAPDLTIASEWLVLHLCDKPYGFSLLLVLVAPFENMAKLHFSLRVLVGPTVRRTSTRPIGS